MKTIEEKGKKTGEVLWPFRVSLSGRKGSPDPFSIAMYLGKDEVLKRIENGIMKV